MLKPSPQLNQIATLFELRPELNQGRDPVQILPALNQGRDPDLTEATKTPYSQVGPKRLKPYMKYTRKRPFLSAGHFEILLVSPPAFIYKDAAVIPED